MIYKNFIDNSKISKICFGTWNLSPSTKKFFSPNTTTLSESINLLRFAFDKGINFFDTADIYGEGVGEKILGKAFRNIRKHIIIITKSGVLNKKNNTNFSKKYIENKIKQSLINLQVYAKINLSSSRTLLAKIN